jgi:endonuclease YncB( thermonuclease family)
VGLLKVNGFIDLDQFWPKGESDADTVKILVVPDAFQFQENPQSEFKVTHSFDKAMMKVNDKKVSVIDDKNRITVRLQGIDTPELHCDSTSLSKKALKALNKARKDEFKKLDKKYRQYFAESCTVALYEMLKRSGTSTVPCMVKTFADEPNDVFDKYARLVGDIEIEIEGKKVNINQWLVENGLAFPAFYASMNDEEIKTLLNASQLGRKNNPKFWRRLTKTIRFNFKLLYRGKGALFEPKKDVGCVVLPKIYRRQRSWAVPKKAKILKDGFKKFLEKNRDHCFLTEEFLVKGHGASIHYLDEFLKSGKLNIEPEDLVFRDSPSALLSDDGTPVSSW